MAATALNAAMRFDSVTVRLDPDDSTTETYTVVAFAGYGPDRERYSATMTMSLDPTSLIAAEFRNDAIADLNAQYTEAHP